MSNICLILIIGDRNNQRHCDEIRKHITQAQREYHIDTVIYDGTKQSAEFVSEMARDLQINEYVINSDYEKYGARSMYVWMSDVARYAKQYDNTYIRMVSDAHTDASYLCKLVEENKNGYYF